MRSFDAETPQMAYRDSNSSQDSSDSSIDGNRWSVDSDSSQARRCVKFFSNSSRIARDDSAPEKHAKLHIHRNSNRGGGVEIGLQFFKTAK